MEQAKFILQELPCGCAILDVSGSLTYANPALCQLLGSSEPAIRGKSIEAILTIASRIFYQTHFFPLLNLKGEVSEIFMSLKTASGAHIPVMVNAKMSVENEETVYICVFAPVWERQKYEEQLLAARKAQQKAIEENEVLNKLKAQLEVNQYQLDRKISILRERNNEYLQMSKVLMHDMQEPVRKISLFFDALFGNDQPPATPDDQRKINIIRKSIQRLRHMTKSLLDFVQINASDEKINFLDSSLIHQAREEVTKNLPEVNIDIQITDLPPFEGRQSQIRRVFVELIKNALQNTHDERPLSIKVAAVVIQENVYQHQLDKYRYTDHVQIEIRDNGSGFDGQYNSYVFGLFNKIDARSGGAGLGLALCRQIISNHYGTIKAQSELGKGTCITIVLPIRQLAE
ncbi:PAS domain-containing sensor histidine kinase [Dyadobacter sp. LJ53]|uniref:PAS domain-containing sensor histidine kinase n=1 Tax=Dyadobacter chenwenxiniae TaxID=2906456 RepID=UPI001F2DE728|nr:PAS domain-containing sensor histidine kinase [Dyadobacter chenwenxiniae]MCF0053584.1 PAS domain-containing sensor histidine kinase [Dyadobacter chenwenxiniae]